MPVLPASIKALQDCFESWQSLSSTTLPLDKYLQSYFKRFAFLGSKDRKLIANALFSYYRWYGWLSLLKKPILFQLLCGYVLDGHKETKTVFYWKKALSFPEEIDELVKQEQSFPLKQKNIISYFVPNVKEEDLFPLAAQESLPDNFIFLQKRPPIWLRSKRDKIEQTIRFFKEQDIAFTQSPILPYSFALKENINLSACSLYQNGTLEVQDISSQIVGEIIDIQETDTLWDMCCGSGGKSLHLAELSNGKAKIYATDIRKASLQNYRKRLAKQEYTNINIQCLMAGETPNFSTVPNKILIDVPCSCSGTWRRTPDLRFRFRGVDEAILQTQQDLLNQAAKVIPVGGHLFYVTCSFLPNENENQLDVFLSQHSNFSYDSYINPITKQEEQGSCAIAPPASDGNWIFIAKLKRTV